MVLAELCLRGLHHLHYERLGLTPCQHACAISDDFMLFISSQWYKHAEYAQRRFAMNFYITTLSQLLTVTEKKKCFISSNTSFEYPTGR